MAEITAMGILFAGAVATAIAVSLGWLGWRTVTAVFALHRLFNKEDQSWK